MYRKVETSNRKQTDTGVTFILFSIPKNIFTSINQIRGVGSKSVFWLRYYIQFVKTEIHPTLYRIKKVKIEYKNP